MIKEYIISAFFLLQGVLAVLEETFFYIHRLQALAGGAHIPAAPHHLIPR